MVQKTDKKALKSEIKKLSDFLSLKNTRYALLFFLLLHIFFSLHYGSAPYSAYLILMALALPPAIASVFKNGIGTTSLKKQRQEKEYILSCLMSHYRFSSERLSGENITFYILVLVSILWQKRTVTYSSMSVWIDYYPTLLVSLTVLLRIIFYIFYRIFLPYKIIRHNY